MVKQKNPYQLIVLIGIFIVIFIPLLQNTLHLKKYIKPLNGAFTVKEDTTLTLANIFSGKYQQKKEEYLNENFGLRNYYVRLNNQINYQIFSKANASKVVVGKSNYLFETDYIEAYLGKNFLGEEELSKRLVKLKKAQDILKAKNILLEVVYAPGKASFYPAYIPNYFGKKEKINNYEFIIEKAKTLQLDFIDFNAWFLKMKPISSRALYPKTGIHWSNYGALLAMDSLRKHIEARKGYVLPKFKITTVKITDSIVSPDNDIGLTMNLWKDIKPIPMPIASYYWLDNKPTKPKALFIGDSYFWNLFYSGLVNNTFTEPSFWYYNTTVFPENAPIREVSKLDFKTEVQKQELIVLLATESNLQDIGWGFVDNVLASFNESTNTNDFRGNVYINYFINEIHHTPDWLNTIKEEATKKGVDLEKLIRENAIYLYTTEYSKPEVIAITEQIKININNTPDWKKAVQQKALEKNITFEEMIEIDAKYVYDKEHKK